jgi:2-polyprenyl-6-hydroxyphenyl methylase / 3-demethylubiquinone-9 3-methyltransferase
MHETDTSHTPHENMARVSYNSSEIEKFNRLSARWWDPKGPCQPLHALNPVRLAYLRSLTSLSQKQILDVGCGGGLLSEAMARAGAQVCGLDLAEDLLDVARLHAQGSGLAIDYRLETVEAHAQSHAGTYDIITCMEMLEHVPHPEDILEACKRLLKPKGLLVLSTINRTPLAFVEAILGAEYLLKILPKGTHRYESFIRPSELEAALRHAGFQFKDIQGIRYNPLSKDFALHPRVSVNYLMCGEAL